jgi:membrane protease YdiL (CAAX protease family)
MVQWRTGTRWYAVALLGPIVFATTAAVVSVALGAVAPTSAALQGWPHVGATFLLLLLVPGMGGTWEEPGWRGYALPRMIADRSPLVASLVIGVIWASWHLPLYLTGQDPWSDVVLTLAMSVVLAAVYLGSGGSLLLVMLMHAMNNAVSGHFVRPMFTGADADLYSLLVGGAWGLAAVIAGVLLATGRWRGPAAAEQQPAASDDAVVGGPIAR